MKRADIGKLSEEGKILVNLFSSKINELKDEYAALIAESKKARNEMKTELKHLYDELKNELTAMIDESRKARDEFTSLHEEFQSFRHDVLIDMKRRDDSVDNLTKEVTFLRGRVAKLEERVEDSEAYERRDCLVFSGNDIPDATTGENCAAEVVTMIRSLNINIDDRDISTAHRLGKKSSKQGPDRRPIIAKLCRRDIKYDIMRACKSQKPKFFINESLTPSRSTLLWALRQMKKNHSNIISGCSSENGRVCMWRKSNTDGGRDHKHFINSFEQLKEFCEKTLKEPITVYIDNWTH